MDSFIDQEGKRWTRSEDGCTIVCEDGRQVLGTADMPFEHLISYAYIGSSIKTDADRIAELEAQVKALLAKLS
jgi:hypothetical protein